MMDVVGAGFQVTPADRDTKVGSTEHITSDPDQIGIRFEQLLWSEMLSHTGLEKAFTQSGGEAASAFSRMIIESIAEDLAESHPLGLSPVKSGNGVVETQAAGAQHD